MKAIFYYLIDHIGFSYMCFELSSFDLNEFYEHAGLSPNESVWIIPGTEQ